MIAAAPRYSVATVTRVLDQNPSPEIVDLISIAIAAYAADRTCHRGRDWSRHLAVQANVSSCHRWQTVSSGLAEALHTLTDDHWELTFGEGRNPSMEEVQARLFAGLDRPVDAIALFSGGLDSYAGAACWLEEHPAKQLGLLSLSTSTVVTKVQRDLAARLKERFTGRVMWLSVPLSLIKAPDIERSQRTRGFLYTAVAAAVARWAKASEVLVFENGYGSLNPRLVEHQQGAQATKSTHPDVLRMFERTYLLAGFEAPIQLPYGDRTKAELLASIPDDLREAIRLTVSCDGFPLRTKTIKQCGTCGSCILRQQAISVAGLSVFDRTDYKESAFDSPIPSKHLWLMASQAWQFSRGEALADYTEAVRRWPEIDLSGSQGASFDTIGRVDVLRRYGNEWSRMVVANPALGARLGWDQ